MSCISEKRNVLRSPAVTTACWVGTPRTRQRRRFLCGPSIWPDFSYLHAVLWKSLLFPRPARATSERSTGDHTSTHAGQPSASSSCRHQMRCGLFHTQASRRPERRSRCPHHSFRAGLASEALAAVSSVRKQPTFLPRRKSWTRIIICFQVSLSLSVMAASLRASETKGLSGK